LKILSSSAMKKADQLTIEEFGMPGSVLMETAGLRIVEYIRTRFQKGGRIVILAGPGNNGGDGLASARLLEKAGFVVSLWSTVKAGTYRGDAGINEKYLVKVEFPLRRISEKSDLDLFSEDLNSADLLVDALLGVGIDRDVEGFLAEIIDIINLSKTPVLAIDIPSGVNADSGAVMGRAVRANWTITFAFPKTGLMLHPGAGLAGDIVVAEINVPLSLAEGEPFDIITSDFVKNLLPVRPVDAHKGSVGRVLIVAGSPGMSGAAVLAAESALQGGAGLVYLAAPQSACPALEAKTLEVVIIPLPESSPGVIDPDAAETIINKARTCDVLAVGPGLDTGEATSELLYNLVQLSPVPMVFDAGALEALGRKINMLRSARHLPVITPHPGEMARLIGKSAGQVQSSRLEVALKNTALWNCIIMLKGPNTIIATPDGRASINPTGNPSLATAGSGDLLTGLVASFIAQGITPENAAKAGAFIHGMSGDLLPSGRGYKARDILALYQDAFLYLESCDQTIAGNPFLTRIRPI
jgi:ADP-dependent NAD(P)H-hydrate dehydratase / NAD(P)H-hydrate epimerase